MSCWRTNRSHRYLRVALTLIVRSGLDGFSMTLLSEDILNVPKQGSYFCRLIVYYLLKYAKCVFTIFLVLIVPRTYCATVNLDFLYNNGKIPLSVEGFCFLIFRKIILVCMLSIICLFMQLEVCAKEREVAGLRASLNTLMSEIQRLNKLCAERKEAEDSLRKKWKKIEEFDSRRSELEFIYSALIKVNTVRCPFFFF